MINIDLSLSGTNIASKANILPSNSPKYIIKVLLSLYSIEAISMSNVLSVPSITRGAYVSIYFDYDDIKNLDFGQQNTKLEFMAMQNGGYVVRTVLLDGHYNTLKKLIKAGYFKESRSKPVQIKFKICDGVGDKEDINCTKFQVAIVIGVTVIGYDHDRAIIEVTAIDPPSWYLNKGKADGSVYSGTISDSISKVVNEYSGGAINFSMTKTKDSEYNKWYMLRMDPKSFILSMLQWASGISETKTAYLIESDGFNMYIKEQGLSASRELAFYKYWSDVTDISNLELTSDSALSIIQTKLNSIGVSSTTGEIISTSVDDSNTKKKKIAKVTNPDQGLYRSFKKTDPNSKYAGYTYVSPIPELDLGVNYSEYMDGKARTMWLGTMNEVLKAKIRVRGHAIYNSNIGLGVDTVFLKWMNSEGIIEADTYYWMTGNWIIYGFYHIVSGGDWSTDLYITRYDFDSDAVKVPSLNI